MFTCLLHHVLDNTTSVAPFAAIRLCSDVGEIVALARSFTENFDHGVMQRWEEVDKEAVSNLGWEKVAQFPDAASEDMPPCLQVLPRRHPTDAPWLASRSHRRATATLSTYQRATAS